MIRRFFTTAAPLLVFTLTPLAALAEGSDTWVEIGPGSANAGASTDAPFGIARTGTRVGRVNVGRGLAVGMGPNGLTLSHTIGVGQNGLGAAHNFNMSIGREGTNIGHGAVVTAGPGSRVIAGGNTRIDRFGPRGGSRAGGTGPYTRAWTESRTRRTPLRWR